MIDQTETKATPTKNGKKASRIEKRKAKRQEKTSKRKVGNRKARIRAFPIWLRLIVVLFLIAASAVLGLMFGYGVIGGGAPLDALSPDTWRHILDIIEGVE
ncbi:DNA-directed RNA polymerase subunit beta [Halalkalibacterium halodurans]|jgi:F0F1-type ATP synthase assembly protein I|uniref:DNA-directed RNA polymerase subunit beta n=1 Tax=Halalkalibacterium halodurans TaxID=86665 RepID=UPI002AAA5EEA|nr:DNA-directed RNA polymerase subunit beta [Halalkalibacterium halodurans]MDY7224242.1 DNA-directed RNA polymerase subunit beta [Halalkalibacterium halodurans]MDY7243527.1 DNA-directed RNA polymerase subunit beta [Halalkalibacterium halodurans]